MSFFWGDGFDCYALPADALLGYWDSGSISANLVTGRFGGSRGWQHNSTNAITAVLQKSSGSNDAVHHLVIAINQSAAITGTTNYNWFTLLDGATAQCSVVFRSDGAILLTSGASNGTTLATYTGALTANNTWYAFEIEIIINNTTGSIAVRKNGNTSNDFSASSLNTRGGTANNYANRLTTGNAVSSLQQSFDDLLWRSDAASVPWVGDIRCYTRRPASDAAVQWTPSSSSVSVGTIAFSSNGGSTNTVARFSAFTASITGLVGTVSITPGVVWTGNVKCSLFASSGATPGAVLGSATPLSAMPSGVPAVFTFGTPVSVVAGTQYWIGVIGDTSVSGVLPQGTGLTGFQQTGTTYAAFPVANPATSAIAALVFTINISPTGNPNTAMVQDAQQDAAASYVYSSTVGQADLYTLSGIDSTPTSIIGVTTRALAQKSDAGTRTITADLKSGGTTVHSGSGVLNTTWGWVYRTDLTDPATGSAWTAVGVNAVQIGATVTA